MRLCANRELPLPPPVGWCWQVGGAKGTDKPYLGLCCHLVWATAYQRCWRMLRYRAGVEGREASFREGLSGSWYWISGLPVFRTMRGSAWTTGLDMCVGKGTETITVISRVRRGDTCAYKMLGTNVNTASSDNPRSRHNYDVYFIDRRREVMCLK